MKLTKILSTAILLCTYMSATAAEPEISISGIVTDGKNPVEKAVVTLVNNSAYSDTTDANGTFSFSNITGIIDKPILSQSKSMVHIRGNRLYFSVPGEIVLYNVKGMCIYKQQVRENCSGSAISDLPNLSAGIYQMKFSTDHNSINQRLVVTSSKMFLCGNATRPFLSIDNRRHGNAEAGVDQLRITKNGFITKLFELSSYKAQNLSIMIEADNTGNETSLCKRYKNYFPIGAAIDNSSYKDAHAAIWKEHFNATVCENEMKWTALQPTEGSFQFTQANAMVNAARSNNMLVRGHVLCWFDQTPDWVFQNASKEVLIGRLKTHITKVMTEFKGRVYAWDVVNEAVIGYDANNQDVGEDLASLKRWGYRNSKWYQIAGEDFIIEAFKAARAADPNAKLFYNDFWNYLDGKREFIISFVKKLKEQNLIDGVGLQCHLNISPAQEKMTNQTVYQTVANLENEIKAYAALGLEVHITELDISIYTRDYGSSDQSKWYTARNLNEEYQNKLAARYKEFFDMFRNNADKIQNVTFWGIADDNTWLSEFTSGRPDHPLLFDVDLKTKKAFDAIMNF